MNWEKFEKGTKIRKDFEFENFKEAISFVNKVGDLAEEANHHPDILIHDYKKVTIMLTTHDEKAVTQKDFKLAEKIDEIE